MNFPNFSLSLKWGGLADGPKAVKQRQSPKPSLCRIEAAETGRLCHLGEEDAGVDLAQFDGQAVVAQLSPLVHTETKAPQREGLWERPGILVM